MEKAYAKLHGNYSIKYKQKINISIRKLFSLERRELLCKLLIQTYMLNLIIKEALIDLSGCPSTSYKYKYLLFM